MRRKSTRKLFIYLIGASGLAFAGLFSLALLHPEDLVGPPDFSGSDLRLQPVGKHYFMNDVAAFDTNQTGLPVAALVSHSARAAVLVNDSSGTVQIADGELFGIRHDDVVGGWGGDTKLPAGSAMLQLAYLQTMLVGVVQVPPGSGAMVHVELPWRARIARRGAVEIVRSRVTAEATVVEFRLDGIGQFQIEPVPPPSDGFPIHVQTMNIPLSEIAVGPYGTSPASATFSVRTRDFHSLAVGELDADGGAEYSVVRGGVRGRIATVEPHARDVFYDTDSKTDLAAYLPGFKKNGCPGRQSAWVDIDSDNRLELFVVCGRSAGESASFANQLLRWQENRFVDVAADAGLDIRDVGSFRFIHWNGDLEPDLLWVQGDGEVVLYGNHSGRFVEHSRIPARFHTSRMPQLLIEDVDEDQDPDLIIVHPAGLRVVLNESGMLRESSAAQHGLPRSALAGSFMDINADGRADLLTDHGYYLAQGGGAFAEAYTAPLTERYFSTDARIVSAAAGGGRGIVVALHRCLPWRLCSWRRNLMQSVRVLDQAAFALQDGGFLEPESWEIQFASRVAMPPEKREVAILLQGPPTNPNSIGGQVIMAGNAGRKRFWIGQNESSFQSQGNFAVYLTAPVRASLPGEARWQDGCRADFDIPPFVVRFVVERPSDCVSR